MRSLSLSITFILLTGLIALAGATPLAGGPQQSGQPPPHQKPPPAQDQDQESTVRLGSRLVLVPVSASDASGQPVKDLKPEDIVIEEEGRPQEVVSLGAAGKAPLEIALLFDVSGSVAGQFAFEQQAAIQFLKEILRPGDDVSLFSIGTTPNLEKARTSNSGEVIAGIKSLGPQKVPTAFFDAVVEAAHYINKTADSGSRRVLVVISDGEENYSVSNTLSDALKEVQKDDCLFYSINPSGGAIKLNVISLKGQNNMEALASQTGGKAFNVAKVEELSSVFHQIAEELQAQYLFGYYSTNEHPNGGFKRIKVYAPKRPDLRIRARQGYYEP